MGTILHRLLCVWYASNIIIIYNSIIFFSYANYFKVQLHIVGNMSLKFKKFMFQAIILISYLSNFCNSCPYIMLRLKHSLQFHETKYTKLHASYVHIASPFMKHIFVVLLLIEDLLRKVFFIRTTDVIFEPQFVNTMNLLFQLILQVVLVLIDYIIPIL